MERNGLNDGFAKEIKEMKGRLCYLLDCNPKDNFKGASPIDCSETFF